MKYFGLAVCLAALCAPASAADYYVTSRYMSSANIGEIALAADSGTIRDATDLPYKIADVVAVNAANRVVTVFTTQIDCRSQAWRVIYQVDHRTDAMMAPVTVPTPQSAFDTLLPGAPSRGTLDFVCAWPGSAIGKAKLNLAGPVALAQKIGPTLNFTLNDPKDGDR